MIIPSVEERMERPCFDCYNRTHFDGETFSCGLETTPRKYQLMDTPSRCGCNFTNSEMKILFSQHNLCKLPGCSLCNLDINDIMHFVLWINLQIYQKESKNMPECYRNIIRNSVDVIGLDKFNKALSDSTMVILDLFVERLNSYDSLKREG